MNNKHKSYADDGWAVWVDGDDVSTVYLNDWLNPDGCSYIDVGLHIRGVQATGSLNIYIPFAVSEEELTDISLRLEDRRVLCAIFGTGGVIDYLKNDCTSEVAYNGRTMDLVHISRLGYTLTPLAGGTLLYVNLE